MGIWHSKTHVFLLRQDQVFGVSWQRELYKLIFCLFCQDRELIFDGLNSAMPGCPEYPPIYSCLLVFLMKNLSLGSSQFYAKYVIDSLLWPVVHIFSMKRKFLRLTSMCGLLLNLLYFFPLIFGLIRLLTKFPIWKCLEFILNFQ